MHLEMMGSADLLIKEEHKMSSHSPTHSEEGYGSDEKDLEHKGAHELKRPDLKGSFRCSICSKVFCHSSSLSRHRMQAHFKSYKCTVCRKDISSSESLRTHMFKQHHISRMYMCRCCNWAFPDKSLLHIHLQSNNNNNNNEPVVPHAVINRSCHQSIQDPFQLIRSPLLSLPAVPLTSASFPVPTISPETSTWLASLPKPIPTTTPIYLTESPKKEDDKYHSQSPSSSASIKSDVSAFHQLSSDRTLLSSPVDTASPSGCSSSSRADCFDCHVGKTKLSIFDTKCKYLENRVLILQNEGAELGAQNTVLEQTVLRLRMEAHVLREHNEMFQRKLLECQNLAVNFLQSSAPESSDVTTLLRNLINATILNRSQ